MATTRRYLRQQDNGAVPRPNFYPVSVAEWLEWLGLYLRVLGSILGWHLTNHELHLGMTSMLGRASEGKKFQ